MRGHGVLPDFPSHCPPPRLAQEGAYELLLKATLPRRYPEGAPTLELQQSNLPPSLAAAFLAQAVVRARGVGGRGSRLALGGVCGLFGAGCSRRGERQLLKQEGLAPPGLLPAWGAHAHGRSC